MKKKIIFVVCALLFIGAAIVAVTGDFKGLEQDIAKFLNPNREKNLIMYFFTQLGEYYGVIAIAAALFIFPPRKQLAFPVAVTTIISWLLNEVIKRIVARPRPVDMILQKHSFSFPSGHAMNNAALYVSMIVCLLPLCKNNKQKAAVALIGILPLIIGITRVYFNVHYVSDVIAGWCLGVMLAILFCGLILKKVNRSNGKNTLSA